MKYSVLSCYLHTGWRATPRRCCLLQVFEKGWRRKGRRADAAWDVNCVGMLRLAVLLGMDCFYVYVY